MTDPRQIVAQNITALRQSRHMTQLELAEKLNYSDKAVSKWERGDAIPDVFVLKAIADLFGVTVDGLLQQETQQPAPVPAEYTQRNHRVITALSILLVWLVTTTCFVLLDIACPQVRGKWLCFLYGLPISMIVWLVFNALWFDRRRNYLIISLLMWSVLLCGMLTPLLAGRVLWQLLLLGVPGQTGIVTWSLFRKNKNEPI